MRCDHINKRFYRILVDRCAPHIRELCPDCTANIRGAGINVAHEEVRRLGIEIESLPIWKDLRTQEGNHQSLLF